MLTLYEFSITRSIRCRWMLEELGVQYQSINVDLSKGEHKRPEFLALNPTGKLPFLTDNEFGVFESAAIITFLGDKYPEKGLVPKAGTQQRALYDQWMYFCMSELEQPLWSMIKHSFIYPPEKRSIAAIELAKNDFKQPAAVLEKHLTNHQFILGSKFSAVDTMIGQTLVWAGGYDSTKNYKLLERFHSLRRYLHDLTKRSAMPKELKEKVQ